MAETVVRMPQLGESVAEGTIGRWLKQPGERVERDEPLLEVQTDKVNAEVPSPVAGVVQRHLQPEGATVAVKTEIAVIGDGAPSSNGGAEAAAPGAMGATVATPIPSETGTGPASLAGGGQGPEGVNQQRPAAASQAAAPAAGPTFRFEDSPGGGVVSSAAASEGPAESQSEAPTPSPMAQTTTAGATGSAAFPSADSGGGRRFYTPVVLRMAEEHHLDLSQVQGSGLGGRVTRKDVERVIAAGGTAAQQQAAVMAAPPVLTPAPTPAAPPAMPAPAPAAPLSVGGREPERRSLTPMRRAIAQHMSKARADIPDAWSMTEVDVSALVKTRAGLLTEFQQREGFELTYLPFFVKAVLAGLRAVPEMNASWEGEGITVHRRYDLGIAVSVEGGLVVPVLRNADTLSLAGVALGIRALVQKARAGRLGPDDLQGGTFTVNNPGSLGSIMSQPVVPVGQSGIVTMEAIVKRPVVRTDQDGNDSIAIRSMMNVCLSFDHRVLDGAQALQFLRTVRMELERAQFSLY